MVTRTFVSVLTKSKDQERCNKGNLVSKEVAYAVNNLSVYLPGHTGRSGGKALCRFQNGKSIAAGAFSSQSYQV